MTSGIYKILNAVNGKVYVGSAVNLARRKKEHLNQWRAGRAVNAKLLNAIRKYWIGSFEFITIELCDSALLLEREAYWIDTLHACTDGYNVRSIPNSNLGLKFPAEAGTKISKALKGRVFSDEHCARISSAKKGIPLSAKERQRLAEIREARSGIPMPQSQRDKTSASLKGKVVSGETRAKLSNASRKLSDSDIIDILALLKQGTRHAVIRAMFPVSERTICSIRQGDGFYKRFTSRSTD